MLSCYRVTFVIAGLRKQFFYKFLGVGQGGGEEVPIPRSCKTRAEEPRRWLQLKKNQRTSLRNTLTLGIEG